MTIEMDLMMQAMAALGIGLLIGLEREYGQRKREDEPKRIEAAGIRTFALVSLSGNLVTWLPTNMMPWGVVLGFTFTALIALLAYYRTSSGNHPDTGITSEVVLVMTFILGVLTGTGQALPATIIAVVIFALLYFKSVLHKFSHSLSRTDIRQATQFLIITVVVLPILPNQGYGPYGAFNPQKIWLMVALISGIGFAAYAAMKLLGHRAGLGLTGILGGTTSSTAVTLAMSRLARETPQLLPACLLAILLACGTMYPRVLVLTLLFAPQVTLMILPAVGLVIITTLIIVLLQWKRSKESSGTGPNDKMYEPETNPLSLRMALIFGAFYAGIILLTHLAQEHFGSGGIMSVAGVSGLSDIDAITLSLSDMTRNGTLLAPLAAKAILLASAANSLVKLGMGLTFAPAQGRRWLLIGLLPMVLISLTGIAFI